MKKLFLVLLGVGLLVIAGCAAASWWIMRQLGPEIWVAQLEANLNCRAHIDDSQLSLLSQPASLIFRGVRLAPRDAEVDKAYAERSPLPADSVPIHLPEVVLQVQLQDLLNRRLFIERLSILEPVVKETIDAGGHSSLEKLFQSPPKPSKAAASPPAITNAPNQPPAIAIAPPTDAPAPPESALPGSDSTPFALSVKSARIEKGRLSLHNQDTTVEVSDFHLDLSDIDVDTNQLDQHNRMRATLSSHIQVKGIARIDGVKRPAELARLQVAGEADITPIHPKTRTWNPSSKLKLTLAKDSLLAGHLTLGDAAGKDLKKLLDYGIDLRPVRIGGPLQNDAVLDGIFSNNRLTLKTATHFTFPDYEVVLEPKSWFNGAEDRHDIDFRLSCGPALQQRLQSGIAKAKLGDSIARAIIKALADEQGRMTFDISSKGSLSSPEVRPKTDRVLKNILRGDGLGDLLQGLLKKL